MHDRAFGNTSPVVTSVYTEGYIEGCTRRVHGGYTSSANLLKKLEKGSPGKSFLIPRTRADSGREMLIPDEKCQMPDEKDVRFRRRCQIPEKYQIPVRFRSASGRFPAGFLLSGRLPLFRQVYSFLVFLAWFWPGFRPLLALASVLGNI